jgi:predicted RNA-binding protein (virulence factor B family)
MPASRLPYVEAFAYWLRRPSGYLTAVGLRSCQTSSAHQRAHIILADLRSNKDRLPYSDSSPPEEIRASFQASKKAFKQALAFPPSARQRELKT